MLRKRCSLLFVLGAAMAAGAAPAAAATLTVTTTRDETTPGDQLCSLREAIQAVDAPGTGSGDCAPAAFGSNTIVLGSHTYALQAPNGELAVSSQVVGLTIVGAGVGKTTVDASGLSDRALEIFAGPVVTIRDLTITGGHARGGIGGQNCNSGGGAAGANGGAIANAGDLTLLDAAVTNSAAGDGGPGGSAMCGGIPSGADGGPGGAGGAGGAIYNTGELTLTDVTFAADQAGRGGAGGTGADNGFPGRRGGTGGTGGPGGTGGAVANNGGILTIAGATIRANRAGSGGVGGTGGVGEACCTGGGNAVGGPGGIGARGGDGGGVWSDGGVLSITNSTFVSNVAGDGGAGGTGGQIMNGGSLGSGGLGGDGGSGGGVDAGGAGSAKLLATTVVDDLAGAGGADGANGGGAPAGPGAAGNSGAGGGVAGAGPQGLTIENSLLAFNSSANCGGGVADGGHNLNFRGSGCPATFGSGDPKLGPLTDNGGPTQTISLGPGSAAIDQIPASGSDCPATDQRGVRRPSGPRCDIGAYEVAPPVVVARLAFARGAKSVAITSTITANGRTGKVWVEYGRTRRYGSRSAVKTVSGVVSGTVSIKLRGLDLRTTYHYRIVATNMDGTSESGDVTLAVPVVKSLRIVPRSFSLTHGAAIDYTDTRAARTIFTVQRRQGSRWVTVATFVHRDFRGRNIVRFGRRLGLFKPGPYRLEATPKTNRSVGLTVRTRFTIVR